jgi:DNA-binding HxlR family transcriptional regulator
MLKRDYEGQVCSVARALELVGERWTLLIIRDAFLGLRRFEEFQQSLGIARNVLATRLDRLVEEGIFVRVPYSERPPRFEYRLTPKGRDLNVALTALRQWGDEHLSERPPVELRRRSDGTPVIAALVPESCPEALAAREVELVASPSAGKRPGLRARLSGGPV